MISGGRLEAGDVCVVEVSGEEPAEYNPRILARVRYQTRLTSNSITKAVIAVKWSDEKEVV